MYNKPEDFCVERCSKPGGGVILVYVGFVLWLCVFFWGQGGWYRIDCALDVQRACELIAAEYVREN